MTAPLSRAVMRVAECCLGDSRREWALAMRGEFEVAAAERRPFAFALGCLAAAWREMPNHAEGQLVLANYALALGMLIPMAVLQFALALDHSAVFAGGVSLDGTLPAGVSANLLLAPSQFDAAPSLVALRLLIGVAHLRLAWVLVEQDWARVAKACALIGAAMASFFLFTGALGLDLTFLAMQAAAMAIEAAMLVGAARRHERLFAANPSWLDS
jgi:hypothetical protein